MTQITRLLQKNEERIGYEKELAAARKEFQEEYVTCNGRLVSDSQAAYAIAICFGLLTPTQQERAGNRLVYLVRKNNFCISTGFAGTPFLCEALALSGHIQIAYAMLLTKECPSWLYPVSMGATTVWERWDSMLPDGSINPGKMTSFNHYAFGSIAKFLHERLAGLQRIQPGWKKCCIAPCLGADFSEASASHETPMGLLSCSWNVTNFHDKQSRFQVKVTVPPGINCEIVIPEGAGELKKTVCQGKWTFNTFFIRNYEWPVKPLPAKS
jgi:alpha-L-rhamnosidase